MDEVLLPEEQVELTATNGEEFPWDDIRLPKFIQPIRYDIELSPNLTSKWVKGKRFLQYVTFSMLSIKDSEFNNLSSKVLRGVKRTTVTLVHTQQTKTN